ncbi:mitochondrial import receptor subunit TOM7-1-like [Hordeum vulgare subsp. vulgare]|uniref:mitochondrial import receptor subunit TOM7-1-like n=1 Tax=Hordeum vulgare subsp. vulgare TaxID=112509 RepID=UPI00162BF380|nr:mitochondrial import receptor subunit TOM7-1-like [Hordeum vulgare subsp. vulgare]KAI4967343.1 hypothetical protein ZWY2020_028349 [Hordeum vulgare]
MAPPTRASAKQPKSGKALGRRGMSRAEAAAAADAAARRSATAREWRVWGEWAMGAAKVVAHYGFIPLVIAVGVIKSDPRPSLFQLLSPV